MYVIKRNGQAQDIHFDKITERLKKLADMSPRLNIDVITVVQKVIAGVYPGMKTTELDELSAETSVFLSTINPAYETLASRITISNLHKETLDDYGSLCDKMYTHIHPKTNKHAPLLSKSCYDFIKTHIDVIQTALDYTQDYTYEYFGIKTLQRSYLLKMDGIVVERIQHLLMRVACGINVGDIEGALKTYQMLSDKLYTLATPTLFNAGTPCPQLSSCFLLNMREDSVVGIYDTLKQTALISKSAGGIGLAVHDVRANGSYIRSTNGVSDGLIPMLRVFNDTARYINQAGKRKGSMAMYLEPHHPDIEDFLELKKNHGKEEMRCRDLFYALWVSDLFMKRVENDQDWSLFCPDECPGLSEIYGDEFVALYEKYEQEGRARKVVKAQALWMQIMTSQIETGVPYLLYKDTSNKHNNQSNLGTLKSSNLCCEIFQYTDRDNVAVCNLASISLPKCVNDGKFDHQLLYDISYHTIHDLNKVIDINYYPVPEAKNSNMKHRPVGLGVSGLSDTFFLLRLPYDSKEAQELNEAIFETIYFASARASCDLAQKHGAYSSFAGSPASQGILCPDMWGKTPSNRWDYDTLRSDIKTYGMRNSLLVALMPTASTSNILGNTECIEPITSNIYSRRVLAGEFAMINKYLIRDLMDLNLWNETTRTKIIANGGSIQNINAIPADLQLLYRTVWEIPLPNQVLMNAARQRFVDQGISFNVFMAAPTKQKLTALHFRQHKLGIKTSSYYIRTRPAVDAIQFTIDKSLLKDDITLPINSSTLSTSISSTLSISNTGTIHNTFSTLSTHPTTSSTPSTSSITKPTTAITFKPNVEIYTKPDCKYCTQAKKLLDTFDIPYITYDVSENTLHHADMLKRSHSAKTVPQIFINNQHIGGCAELVKIHESNILHYVIIGKVEYEQSIEYQQPVDNYEPCLMCSS